MSRALVTGGGGFVGRYIVRQLLERGQPVRVFGRNRYPFLDQIGAECVVGDLTNASQVREAAANCDIVYHVAAIPGVWGSYQRYHDINVSGTQHVIDACRHHNIGRLIFTSSPSVVFDGDDHLDADESLPYPTDYLCAYPKTKALAEQLVLQADSTDSLRTTSLRPHLVFGPEDVSLTPKVHSKARSGRLRIIGDGMNRISVAYVENVAAAHLQAADELADAARCGGKAYFINEPESVSTKQWINTLLQFGDLPPCEKHVSFTTAYTLGSMLETLWSLAFLKSEPPMTRFVALQLAKSHTYRIDAARKDFDYRPLVTWDEALRRTASYYNA